MPCIHLYVPPSMYANRYLFSWLLISSLKCRIADAACVSRDDVSIYFHLRETAKLPATLTSVGTTRIFGEVYWYAKENRDQKAMDTIATALQHFLNEHGLGKGFDLTFFPFPAGSFYAEKDGVATMVPGGEALPPNNRIAQTVYLVTGWEIPGVITNE